MFILSSEHNALKQKVREIAEKNFAPKASLIDRYNHFPRENMAILAEHGLFGLNISPEYGGSGRDTISQMIAIEEVARVCASTSVMITSQVLTAAPLIIAGTEPQKKKFLHGLATGKMLGAFAITERQAGSDNSAMLAEAKKGNGCYILNATKCFVANGGEADCYVVIARTDPNRGTRGFTLFIVEKGRPGLLFGEAEDKMGIRGAAVCEVILDNCKIPEENRLGEEGQGYCLMMQALDHARLAVAAQAVGIAQGALDYALQYARERSQFGKPIASFQAIQTMLADMATQIEAARLLVYHAASLADLHQDRALTKAASMAKVFASDTAIKVANDAIQILGGYGYMRYHPVERMMRDAKITQIYVGTNQIQRIIIAGQMFR